VRFLLVHSPALGPASWHWVAEALRHAGHEPIVPDLTGEAASGSPVAFAIAAARAAEAECIVVGHSGAGALLPLVAAQRLSAPHLVFVDAVMPPCAGTFSAGGDFIDTLRALASDGLLPIWSRWWGDGVLETLVPQDDRRRRVAAELPRVPLSFYETPLVAPLDWCTGRASYVLLSESYRSEADRARSLGWAVTELARAHLDIVHRPQRTVDALLDLIGPPAG